MLQRAESGYQVLSFPYELSLNSWVSDNTHSGEQAHFVRGVKQSLCGTTGSSAPEAESTCMDSLAPASQAQRGNKTMGDS